MNKNCSKCKKEYPRTEEYFYRDRRVKGGFISQCKECVNKRNNLNSGIRKKYNNSYHKKNSRKIKSKRSARKKTPHGRFIQYVANARRKNYAFDISEEQFISLTQNKCYYCDEYTYGTNFVGLDRINSKEGYTQNNIVPCCEFCNRMKMEKELTAFLSKIEKIYKNRFHDEKEKEA